MFRTRYFRFLIIAAAAVAAACTADPVYPDDPNSTDPMEGAEPASLTLNFSIADLGIDVSTRGAGMGMGMDMDMDMGTRAETDHNTMCPPLPIGRANLLNPDNPLPKLHPVEDEEGNAIELSSAEYLENYRITEAALIDGSMMTCLTVILINYHDNKIVAVRRIPDPSCPNHDMKYQGQGGTHSYPPPPGDERNKAKKNCILVKKEDGTFDLAPVLRKEDGSPKTDEQGHITGLVGTHACVTFDYENPIHIVKEGTYKGQSAEKLVRGEYSLLVIANYDHNVTTASAEGEQSERFQTLNVDKTLENLVDKFHEPEFMANGIPNFTSEYKYIYDLRFLMNRTLDGVETNVDGQPTTVTTYNVVDLPVKDKDGNPIKPYIRPAVHQTLTAAMDIYLTSGDNVIDVELQRIASRTRVEVKNYADIPLKIHSLDFSPNYTQSTCYLFRRNKSDRDYKELATNNNVVPNTTMGIHGDHDGKGAPMVDYTGIYNLINNQPTYGAIVPFIKDWDSDDDPNAVKDGVKVPAGKKSCIFDALMYESSLQYKDESHNPADPDSFYYTIDVSYPSVKAVDANNDGIADTKGYVAQIDKIDTEKDYYFDHFDSSVINYEPLLVNEYTDAKEYIQPVPGVTFDVKYVKEQIDKVEEGLNKDAKGHTRDMGESLCFFVQTIVGDKYVYEKTDGTLYAERDGIEPTTTDVDLDSYLWVIEDLEVSADGTYGYCYVKNLGSGHYMPTVPVKGPPFMICTSAKPTQKLKLGITDNNFTFSSLVNGTPYYANLWEDKTYFGGWTADTSGSQFHLYPIKRGPLKFYDGTPRVKKKVELTAFSDKTGFVEKVREIKRNDFIRILVEVSYNSDSGTFEFQVNSWDKASGDIEFH